MGGGYIIKVLYNSVLKWLSDKCKSDLFRFAFSEHHLGCNAKNGLEKPSNAERWPYKLLQLSRQDAMVTWINNIYVLLIILFLIYQLFLHKLILYTVALFILVFYYHLIVFFSLNCPYNWVGGYILQFKHVYVF